MKRLFKHLSIYGLGGILAKSISFLLLPLYTRILTPEDYGILALVAIVGSVIGIFYGFMISSGFIRNYYDSSKEMQRRILFSSALWFTLFNVIIFSLIGIYFSEKIASLIFEFPGGSLYIKLIVISTMLHSCSPVFYGLLMVREQSRKYVAVNIITLIATLSSTIVLLVVFKWSVKGVLVGQIIGISIEVVVLTLLMLKNINLTVSWGALIDMLKFSGPLIPTQLAYLILTLSDRFFLQGYKNVGEVGLYSLGYKFAAIIPLFAIQPLNAWGPYIFSLIHNPKKCKSTIADFSRYYLSAILFLTILVSIFSREVLIIMAKSDFFYAWKVVYLLCLSSVFFGMIHVVSYGFHIVKKTWITSSFFIFGAAVNLLFNYLLIPKYGMIGASVATSLSFLCILLGYFIFLEKVYSIPFRYFKFLFAFIISGIVYYISTFIQFGVVQSILLKILVILLFPTILILFGYFNKIELQKGKIIILKVKKKLFSMLNLNFQKT